MNVSCNVCHKTLEGPAARTDCCHCFCISCATKAFSDNCICPICKSRLQSGNVAEILVGVVPMSVSDCLFQTAFQSTSWDHVISNMQIINRSVCEFTSFIEFQMLLRATHDNQSKHTLQNHAEAAKTELAKISAQLRSQVSLTDHKNKELDHKLLVRESELEELKNAYKEKSRKCSAWEKAYNSLRASTSSNLVTRDNYKQQKVVQNVSQTEMIFSRHEASAATPPVLEERMELNCSDNISPYTPIADRGAAHCSTGGHVFPGGVLNDQVNYPQSLPRKRDVLGPPTNAAGSNSYHRSYPTAYKAKENYPPSHQHHQHHTHGPAPATPLGTDMFRQGNDPASKPKTRGQLVFNKPSFLKRSHPRSPQGYPLHDKKQQETQGSSGTFFNRM